MKELKNEIMVLIDNTSDYEHLKIILRFIKRLIS